MKLFHKSSSVRAVFSLLSLSSRGFIEEKWLMLRPPNQQQTVQTQLSQARHCLIRCGIVGNVIKFWYLLEKINGFGEKITALCTYYYCLRVVLVWNMRCSLTLADLGIWCLCVGNWKPGKITAALWYSRIFIFLLEPICAFLLIYIKFEWNWQFMKVNALAVACNCAKHKKTFWVE